MAETNGTAPQLTGRVGSLTEQQSQVLEQFKAELTQKSLLNAERHDDHLLLRFLRARKFDLPRAVEMFTNCEQWRKDKDVEGIFQNFKFEEWKEVNKIYPRFYHKTDKLGRPIYIEVLGGLNLEQLFQATSRERLEKQFILEYEKLIRVRLPACSKAAGKHIETSCTILDLKNCSVMQALKIRDLLKLITDIGQNYYPETMGVCFIINAPWIFDTVWSVVKIWMDEVTVKKFQIFKSGKDHSAALFQVADPANIPFIVGGACKCPEGCDQSDAGPWNPKN
ncbi:hypothetical protein MIR68_011023 [Amoeboaphelidium protococcarum]|nr:hypothetical protein MIR68_011023 [Amoeboaphelidium protococcarum]KAI3651260.1 hypothetical protein MP228_004741 [Amoeboaphelidium protococcarum]